MANPRIDELNRRLEREPGSRLFAQLAEELRKDGDLPEAIRVARGGLALHPNYPSARMTLGRALFDTGQLAAARSELESVLRGAPDNILAARMLAECLEGLGDHGTALLQYRAAQRLAPADRQIEAQIRALEQRLAPGGVGGRVVPPPLPGVAPQVAAGGRPEAPPAHRMPPPPIPPLTRTPLVAGRSAAASSAASAAGPEEDFDDVFESSPSWQRPPAARTVPSDDAILLLEDEAPTLPGNPFGPPGAGAPPPPAPKLAPPHMAGPPPPPPALPAHQAPPPLARDAPPPLARRPETMAFDAAAAAAAQAPVTMAFEAQQVEGPWGEEPTAVDALGADTLAGRSAFGPEIAEDPFAPSPAAATPVPASPPVGAGAPGRGGSGEAPGRMDTGAFDRALPAMYGDTSPTAAYAVATPKESKVAPPRGSAPPTAESMPSAAPDEWFASTLPGKAGITPPTVTSEGTSARGTPPVQVAPPPPPEAPALSSSTLAELYFEQGFFEKAIEVYEQLLEREPRNERARARLIEIEARARTEPPPPDDPRLRRRRALVLTIARLEQMLAAVRRA